MTTPPLIRRLTLRNFLSYGSEGMSVDLRPLNVLIGPNASGKSNLLEALTILRASARDLQAAVREGGGMNEYLWKGGGTDRIAEIGAEISLDGRFSANSIGHTLGLGSARGRLEVWEERIAVEPLGTEPSMDKVVYTFLQRGPLLFPRESDGSRVEVSVSDLRLDQSILAQRRDPDRYPEVSFLADFFSGIALFQDWTFGRRAVPRRAQATDLPSDFLLQDGRNLGLVLLELMQTSAKREELISYLRRFYEPARSISVKVIAGTVQLFIEEEGDILVPVTRLSDGTLRYLCLLAILCHPNPPPVIGIEEPELGLHPDILPTIAELLKKASERTQLFVTTHSDALVSALSDVPESILVCESMPQGTTIERLEPERLREWLEEYRLGEIWRMGEIGGNRW
jgi:predicted ATPase